MRSLAPVVSITSQQSLGQSSAVPLPDQIAQIHHALTADELAVILAVSKITIYKQAKAGRIPSFRIGTAVRFDPHAVAKWLRTQ